MAYYLALSLFLITLLSLFLTWQAYRYMRSILLWKKALLTPFSSEWEDALQKIPHYCALPNHLRDKIRPKMHFFAWSKEFKGVGIQVDEGMKATISFYACLLVVEIPDECYDELVTILLYPYDIISKEVRDRGGIYEEARWLLEGQSSGDTIVIAWHEAKRQAYHLRHHNVVIHELAHVLDFEDGLPNGLPPVERSRLHRFSGVLYKHFATLQKSIQKSSKWDDYRLIGEYAASNEAEFFAVVTELFFLKPTTLKSHFPDLYEEFRAFYHLDTAELFKNIEHCAG